MTSGSVVRPISSLRVQPSRLKRTYTYPRPLSITTPRTRVRFRHFCFAMGIILQTWDVIELLFKFSDETQDFIETRRITEKHSLAHLFIVFFPKRFLARR